MFHATTGTKGDRGVRASRWPVAIAITIAATWTLMVLGALTRAAEAGVACPDWPLCHGYVVPPLDQASYPPDASYLVGKVYLEFLHRALAALVSVGAIAIALGLWARNARAPALAVWAVLAVQVLAGAVTVWLRNAPYTVVVHLALALALLGLLLLSAEKLSTTRPSSHPPRRVLLGTAILAGLVALQMLVGSAVSSGGFGLACDGFPLCSGSLWPADWHPAVAWQMAHRALGAVVLVAALGVALAWWRAVGTRGGRGIAVLIAGAMLGEALLGAVNVWLWIPPWASAAHLGLAAGLFGLLVRLAVPALALGPSAAPGTVRPAAA